MLSVILWVIGSVATYIYLLEDRDFENTNLTVNMTIVTAVGWPIFWVISLPMYKFYFVQNYQSLVKSLKAKFPMSDKDEKEINPMGFDLED